MSDDPHVAVTNERSHIIARPRLTQALDDCTSRVILLVASAGYGKTTLARQWLATRPHVWYRCTPASADVAALAIGIADAARQTVPEAGGVVRERLRLAAPAEDATELGALLADAFLEWPADTWVAFDDYHHVMASSAAEAFVDTLIVKSALRLMVTSRSRPAWSSARRLLYGEIYELDRTALAMTPAEASTVLRGRASDATTDIIHLASGWPAVLGLAALTPETDFTGARLTHALYDYFAEELFQAASPPVQAALIKLSFLPSLDGRTAQELFGSSALRALQEAVSIGFITETSLEPLELHPLLRGFLRRKASSNSHETQQLVRQLGELLLIQGRWDDVYALLSEMPDEEITIRLLREGARDLFDEGRLETIARLVEIAHDQHIHDAAADFVEAELALRQGLTAKAEALATNAARAVASSDPLYIDGLLLAGRSAQLADRYDLAAHHYRQALDAGTSDDRRTSALWGLFLASHYLELPDTTDILTALKETSDSRPDSLLRLANAHFHEACRRSGDLRSAVAEMERASNFIPRADDPHVAASFLLSFGHALVMTGSYAEANSMSELGLNAAHDSGISLAAPVAHCVQAFAAIGLRQFRRAAFLIDLASNEATELRDVYNAFNAKMARAKLLLAQGRHADACAATDESCSGPYPHALVGEYLAMRSLALCGIGDLRGARSTYAEAEALTTSVEARTLTRFARALAGPQARHSMESAVREAFAAAEEIGHLDGIVLAYRSFPVILDVLTDFEHDARLQEIRKVAHDAPIPQESAPGSGDQGAPLSPRESEVYALLAKGLSNRAIAEALFISESTAKLHVRHILRKLGVRTRFEAALKSVDR